MGRLYCTLVLWGLFSDIGVCFHAVLGNSFLVEFGCVLDCVCALIIACEFGV